MPRRNRTTQSKSLEKNHRLKRAKAGSGRRAGDYLCGCGEPFTSIHAYETHRATKRRERV